jgi:hypothetical protein
MTKILDVFHNRQTHLLGTLDRSLQACEALGIGISAETKLALHALIFHPFSYSSSLDYLAAHMLQPRSHQQVRRDKR